ncbi:hypothetical protein K0M31_008427 [Melipona bicolor]|uniref:Uncharacterized protein n=1 Tax=Melipona bicolor TaxID=60889 RepID=A0AA40KKF6_9HYME|nr:hypothetical protein K0M31_008427 [Melipona bicolor]
MGTVDSDDFCFGLARSPPCEALVANNGGGGSRGIMVKVAADWRGEARARISNGAYHGIQAIPISQYCHVGNERPCAE